MGWCYHVITGALGIPGREVEGGLPKGAKKMSHVAQSIYPPYVIEVLSPGMLSCLTMRFKPSPMKAWGSIYNLIRSLAAFKGLSTLLRFFSGRDCFPQAQFHLIGGHRFKSHQPEPADLR